MTNNTTAPSSSTDPIDPILREIDLKAKADQKRRARVLRRKARKAILATPKMPQSLADVDVVIHRMFNRWRILESGEKFPKYFEEYEFYTHSNKATLSSDERECIGGEIAALMIEAELPSREAEDAVNDAIRDVANMYPGY